MSNNTSIHNRPYRSHRVPACTRCRSRKIRCHIDIPNEPCLSCRERRLKCQYGDSISTTDLNEMNGNGRPLKKPRLSNDDTATKKTTSSQSAPSLPKNSVSTTDQSSIMLGPAVAEDIDILQRHISQHKPSDEGTSELYQTVSHDALNPIIYLSVPRNRRGLRPTNSIGEEQVEILEQIFGPFKYEVLQLFFSYVHCHFPILDDETSSILREGSTEKISKSLLCVVYAIASPNWRKSDILKMHPKPDPHYVWNKAINAVLEDFLSPSLATVSAAVLDLVGRPSISIVGNITLCGRTVGLAHTLGLHRDPSKWKVSEDEKSMRIRLWWGVLITDYWASIAYGTPPHVAKGFYDVPMPVSDSLLSSKATMAQKYASTCFIHLCSLTELLGDILPLVYHIGPNPEELERAVEQLGIRLNNLESQLPEWLPLPSLAGTSNLWFCFLSMRLLLNRVALRAAVLIGNAQSKCARLDELRASSAALLDFILFLGESQFQDFWLPYAAHLLVLATMVDLRCLVEAPNNEIRSASILRLERFLAHIQSAHDNYDWDVANYCLERCSDPINKISSLLAQETHPPPEAQPNINENGSGELATALDDPSFLFSDRRDPNAFDFSWEALWDTPSAMPNFSI
ncbi:C6 transcription factor-like protein [Lindgomyces ingoldianus]|uniref:C6 transcription factor-like protein n=1 Tax=Lindgomyces ingoldianus TaxID=673940 RepID=A0ACB6RFD4_9PLEO|nr:C6 transcription factor-like protein [Lindgomyces ingoldianus]KAF2477765.1 C6 transcription factor-like protein [Lindgomyces ingoldianus]